MCHSKNVEFDEGNVFYDAKLLSFIFSVNFNVIIFLSLNMTYFLQLQIAKYVSARYLSKGEAIL